MKNPGLPGRSPASCVRRTVLMVLTTMTALAFVDRVDADEPDATRIEFNIPAQSVPNALSEFARQAQAQLLFISGGFEHVDGNAVVGTYSAQEALDLLLEETGLAGRYSADSGIKVSPVSGSTNASASEHLVAAPKDQGNTEPNGNRSPRLALEEIVVTGTSIRGIIPESTPLTIYDAVDIRNSGALTVEGFVSMMPQNSGTLTETGQGASSREPNGTAISAVDLRGLGVGTTLVLLNGRRLAPASNGRTPDLSLIPLGAVERVEVLTDGASAIYGADAIGGVINFVLKDQQDGAESVVTYGGASGGSELMRIDHSVGFNWRDGNALIALSHMKRNELAAGEREFARAAAPSSLVPADTRSSLLMSASKRLPLGITVSGDILHSVRKPRTVLSQSLAERVLESAIDHEQTVYNLELTRPISRTANGAVLLTLAKSSADQETVRTPFGSNTSGTSLRNEDARTLDVTAKLDGELAAVRSGAIMYAVGLGHTTDEFSRYLDATGIGSRIFSSALDRRTEYAFAELLVPVVSAEQRVSGIRRLELTLATRYTSYSDFGDNTSPKVGILWSPIEPLIFRSTFGESFKAPFLVQLDPTLSSYGLFQQAALGLPDIWTPDGSAIVLFAQGPGNPALGPEKAQTYTVGFDLDLSGLTLSATYFEIDYTDRIAEPDPSGGFIVLGNPQEFPDLFQLSPTLAQVDQVMTNSIPFLNLTDTDISDPAAVHAATTVFFDNRIRNLSITEVNGLDILLDYSTEAFSGELSLGVQASRAFGFVERATRSATPVSRVDTVLFPADFKARGYVGFEKDRWNARLNANYVDEYANPFAVDNQAVDSWTTLDLLLSYRLPTDGAGILDDVRLALSMQNLLDEDPPFVAVGTTTNTSLIEPIGFDPANANPLGRFISLQITKEW